MGILNKDEEDMLVPKGPWLSSILLLIGLGIAVGGFLFVASLDPDRGRPYIIPLIPGGFIAMLGVLGFRRWRRIVKKRDEPRSTA